MTSSWNPGAEPVAQKFKAAWNVFAASCGHLWANEASYQAWFAHYLIGQFGIDRVGREVIINEKYFVHSPRPGEVRPDAVVARKPGIMIPHYANGEARSSDESGIGILKHLAVISELKVGASTASGLQRRSILADVFKLGRLLEEHSLSSPNSPMPLAFVCVLDNHHRQTIDLEALAAEVREGDAYHPDVELIRATAIQKPVAPADRALVW
ncbi:hypothetical protein NNX28_02255 [Arthrobacter sp. zg-Y859]|uniref:Uncharacterized protein n=1 Tax=Arthrobacter jinronghuae TaxID=2964609 RepID=A0ABT1NMH4_9MICC|nr:hypothetical protein [Arthrobacter jinronghuae]MCQ1948752.1 hypothetical protein [Arthrobacter jinronghuae]UWX78435.1 hypothetical protein N2K98_16010 [Arthrobacter jinronghuae]